MTRFPAKTPQSEYQRRFREIDLLVTLVRMGLQTHRSEHALRPNSWTPVGELTYVRHTLRELWSYLTPIEPRTFDELLAGVRVEPAVKRSNGHPEGELSAILDRLVYELAEEAMAEADLDGECERFSELWRLARRARELVDRDRHLQ